MKINLKFSHFEEIHKKGYNLDMVYMLQLIDDGEDIKTLCCELPRLETLCQTLYRKLLITKDFKIAEAGRNLLNFVNEETPNLVKKKAIIKTFDTWWKAYPGTDAFNHKGKSFFATRSLRVRKDECKKKFEKILDEGQYTADDLIAALEYEVLQKKENSIKTKTNKMSFMQNSLTYLNQRTFEPFIELIKEGVTLKEAPEQKQDSTDI